MKQFGGTVLFLNRSDINTDEIIPEKYVTENSKQLAPYLFEDLKLDGFNSKSDTAGKKVIIARENFGCGTPRGQAAGAIGSGGIHTVVAQSFAHDFRQDMLQHSIVAVEIDRKSLDDMFRTFSGKDTECKIVINDEGGAKVKLIAGSLSKSYPFKLHDSEKAILENDTWAGYIANKY